MLLWLWCRPAAVAPTQALAWEPPYASGATPKRPKKKKKKKNPFLFLVIVFLFIYELFCSLGS